MRECDCGAEAIGKWAGQHTHDCASLQPSPMTRDEIIELIDSMFDPVPADWPRHRGWDDGAGDIADQILARFGQPNPDAGKARNALRPINPIKLFGKCPLCGLTPERGLHRFCTRGGCPVR